MSDLILFGASPTPQPEPERKTLTEDILGDFGFRVVWSYLPHWADVKVYSIEARGMDDGTTPMFPREGRTNSGDHVLDISEAEVYLQGHLKWDGCNELDQGSHHFCEEEQLIKHCLLLRYLWQKAHQLMERSDCRA